MNEGVYIIMGETFEGKYMYFVADGDASVWTPDMKLASLLKKLDACDLLEEAIELDENIERCKMVRVGEVNYNNLEMEKHV